MQSPPTPAANKPQPSDEDGGFDLLLAQLRPSFAAIAATNRPGRGR